MKTRNLMVSMTLILFLATTQTVLAYHANLHPIITREAINLLGAGEDNSLYTYLQNNLGFENGLNERFRGPGPILPHTMSVREWIEQGSRWEDKKFVGRWIRAPRHLYDPTRPPGRLTDITPNHADLCGPDGQYFSALEWAQARPDSNDPYSWADARNYYYLALTSATKEERDENFAKTFRALGQVIHLLEDMAVPAHVRNDNHADIRIFRVRYGDDFYEGYCTPDADLTYDGYPVVEFEQLKPESEEYVSFNDFWDTNIGSDTFGKGLAEFTNHNFVSRDTNLDVTYGIHNYVYPFKTGEHREDFTFQDGDGNWRTVKVTYVHTNATDNYDSNESVIPFKYLTVYSFFNCYTQELGHEPVYTLNRKCHEEYAKLLLPRAVGYSAGLLNYFFRGKFKVEMEYIPDTIPVQYELTITNKSGEKMEGGTLDLYYWNEDEDWSKVSDFSSNYSGTLEDGGEAIAEFTVPSNIFYPETYYTLVFRGKLGQEEDAVIGRAIKLEPLGHGGQSIGIWGETATSDPHTGEWITAPPVWAFTNGPAPAGGFREICGPITHWKARLGDAGFQATPEILRIVCQVSTAGLKEDDYDRFYLQGYLVDTHQNPGGTYYRGRYPAGAMKVYKTDVSQGWEYVWNNTSEVVFSKTVPSTWKFYSIEIPKEMINFEGTTAFVFMLTDESGESEPGEPWGVVFRHISITDWIISGERFLNGSGGWRLFGIKTGNPE